MFIGLSDNLLGRVSIFSLLLLSCVTIKFPENIKVDITTPENFDGDKIQILVVTP